MEPRQIGAAIMIGGVALVLVGALVYVGALGWFGRLPGDVRIEREGMRVYVPLASMIVVSVLLSVLLAILRRLR